MSRPAFRQRSFPKTTWGKVQRQPPLPPGRRPEKHDWVPESFSVSGGAGGDASFLNISVGNIHEGERWGGGIGGTG